MFQVCGFCFLWASQKDFPLSNSTLAQTQLFFWYWNSNQIWGRSYKVRFLKRTILTQPVFTYLKSTIETLEQDVKYVQS